MHSHNCTHWKEWDIVIITYNVGLASEPVFYVGGGIGEKRLGQQYWKRELRFVKIPCAGFFLTFLKKQKATSLLQVYQKSKRSETWITSWVDN